MTTLALPATSQTDLLQSGRLPLQIVLRIGY